MEPPKGDKQAAKFRQRDLARALRKVSSSQKTAAEPNAALKAAIETFSPANKSAAAEAIKKISAGQSPSAKWTKAAQGCSDLKSKTLADTLRRIAAAQKESAPAPTVSRLIGLRDTGLPKTPSEAHGKAFRSGLIRGIQETGSLSVNPWPEQTEFFPSSATEALREDWMRVECDLWATVEEMTQQLEELPPQMRIRLAKALAQYLRSRSAS